MTVIYEHGMEAVAGLPGPLPPGERVLWRGGPRWTELAVHGLHVRTLALYFSLLLVWHGWAAFDAGATPAQAAAALLLPLTLALLGLGLVLGYAWLSARSAIYTLTNRRLVMRFGVALPMTMNLPFAVVAAVDLKRHRHSGDIALAVLPGSRVSYLLCWPHVRPWYLSEPQPMLRCVADADHVAGRLVAALAGTPPAGARGDAARGPGPATLVASAGQH